jgi:hypothetical protein
MVNPCGPLPFCPPRSGPSRLLALARGGARRLGARARSTWPTGAEQRLLFGASRPWPTGTERSLTRAAWVRSLTRAVRIGVGGAAGDSRSRAVLAVGCVLESRVLAANSAPSSGRCAILSRTESFPGPNPSSSVSRRTRAHAWAAPRPSPSASLSTKRQGPPLGRSRRKRQLTRGPRRDRVLPRCSRRQKPGGAAV